MILRAAAICLGRHGVAQTLRAGASRGQEARRPGDKETRATVGACARLSAVTLNEELDRIFAARDRRHMQATIDAPLRLYAAYPDNARVLYQLGIAYDTAGVETTAKMLHEKALVAGREGDLPRRCYVQRSLNPPRW